MAAHTTECVRINRCAVEVLKGGAGPTLLFLHGAGGAHNWSPYMERLAEHYSLIVPSPPGYGRSDTPEWLDNVSDLAFFYLDFLEAQKLRDVHLVGNSLGGWLACEIAVRSTERLKSLTLVSPGGIHVKGVPKGDIFLWSPETRVRNTFYDQKLAEARLTATPSPEEADIALKNHFATAKLAWHPRFYNPDLHKWLHRVRIPTMILWGDFDKVFPPAYGHAFRELIPNSELRIIPQCGHLPHQEKLDAFVDGVRANIEGARSLSE
jgi:pimeloyl-ACP methyl ester carboxylesterase